MNERRDLTHCQNTLQDSISILRMGHDVIHNWLDMMASRLAGDKKAYKRYKEHQKEERERESPRHRSEPSMVRPVPALTVLLSL
jgi:hypothetical protein